MITVAIPTYNRSAHLKDRLGELVPQLREGVSLCIYDNGSTDSTPEVAGKYASTVGLKYFRSETNMGMSRNIMRCFEQTRDDWIWVLGDDDRVRSDAVQTALELVAKHDASVINFNTSCCYNSEERKIGTLEEVMIHKDVTSLMHISSNIYRRKDLVESFKVMAPAAVTMAPHVALIFHAVQSGNASIWLSRAQLLNEERNPRRYSSIELAIGLCTFPVFINDIGLKALVALHLRVATRWMLMWGLTEVRDRETFRNWRVKRRVVDETLKAYGAGHARFFVYSLRKSRSDLKREVLLWLLNICPLFVLLIVSRKQRARLDSVLGEISYELH